MNDLEFIQEKTIRLKDIVVFNRNASIISQDVLRKLREYFSGYSEVLIEFPELNRHLTSSLFNKSLYFVSCSESDLTLEAIKDSLSILGENKIVFFPAGDFGGTYSSISLITSCILPTIWSRTKWDGILQDLLRAYYPDKKDVKNYLQLRSCLQELKETQSLSDLELIREFHFTLITFVSVDPDGSIQFDWTSFKKHYEKDKIFKYFHFHKMLGSFLADPSEVSLLSFLNFSKNMDVYKMGGLSYCDLLYRAAFELQGVNEALISRESEGEKTFVEKALMSYAKIPPEVFIKFLSLLSVWEVRIRNSEDLFISLKGFFESYAAVGKNTKSQ